MINFEQLTLTAKELIEADEIASANNTVTLSFHPRTLPNPLLSLYTVVKPLRLEVEENTEENAEYGKVVRYTLGISIHKAERRDPSELLSKFSAILDVFESSASFTVEAAGYDTMKRDPDTNSIALPAYITFKMYY